MIGDTSTGYIVTPHSDRTRLALSEIFRGRLNMQGEAVRRRLRGSTRTVRVADQKGHPHCLQCRLTSCRRSHRTTGLALSRFVRPILQTYGERRGGH